MLSKTKKKTKKKATKKAAKRAAKKTAKKIPKKTVKADKAHQPGHRKMKIAGINEATAEKTRLQPPAMDTVTRADIIRRRNSKHRRIITGAALGKTGRITIKD